MAVCKYHPDRPGVGVCMRCRAVVCAACTTRLDGVNHCHACLRKLAARTEDKQAGIVGRVVGGGALILAGSIPLFVLFYLLQGRFAP